VNTPSGRWRAGLAYSLGATLLWASLPIALKALVEAMDAQTIAWYRFLGAAIVLGAYLHRRRALPSPAAFRGSSLVALLIAICGLTANNVVFVLGLDFISPSAAQVVIQLAPIFLLVGAVLLFGERFDRGQWAGFVILIGGLALFFNQRLEELSVRWTGYTTGILFVVLAALLWAAYGLAQKRLLGAFRPAPVLWLLYLAGSLLLLPLADPGQVRLLDGVRLALLVYCSLATVGGYGSFVEAMVHWEASRVSAVIATCPLLTVGLTAAAARAAPQYVQPENLNALSVAGAALVVVGSIVAARALPVRTGA
jgi:drug/metabolite transporter (DMT)-like permease